jgi:hypothetical protein
VAANLNHDGTTDLVLAGGLVDGPYGLGVCLGNGDGTFQSEAVYPAGTDNVYAAAVGDFNGDGIPDAAVAGTSGLWLFAGRGGGAFKSGVMAVTLAGVENLAAAHFNGDHNLDLAATLPFAGNDGSGAGFAVLLCHGNGTFQPPKTFAQPKKPLGLAIGRLTKGGHPGIALSEDGYTTVYLYYGNGAGGFSAPRTL